MAKRNSNGRKLGGAASIAVIDDDTNHDVEETVAAHADPEPKAAKPARAAKPKAEPPSNGNFSVGDIKKAAAFANSIGGLDKAIAVLQILKVAKEVQ
jgi:hypothetical protein